MSVKSDWMRFLRIIINLKPEVKNTKIQKRYQNDPAAI